MRKALAGIRVLDLSRVLAGPYCTMILGDLGADVIKVETPNGGDDTRTWGPPFKQGVSAYYLCANRNKRSIAIDLKSDQGRQIVKDLVAKSDVVIENFRPGKADELGIGYTQLQAIQPGIIYCSISGFGQSGPYRDLPGYDFIIQAMSGLMSVTGDPDGPPTKVGVAVADVFTGLYAAIAIVSALRVKEHTGKGQQIDISLLDAQVAALVNVASNYLIGQTLPRRYGNQHPNIVPYQTFSAIDGDLTVAVGNDAQFKRLCQVLSAAELSEDTRFSTNEQRVHHRAELIALLQEAFMKKDCQTWLKLLTEHGIPCGPIHNLEQLFHDPHVLARGMVHTITHPLIGPIQMVGSPLKMSESPVSMERHPPELGEHTDEILIESGYTPDKIIQLRASGIVR